MTAAASQRTISAYCLGGLGSPTQSVARQFVLVPLEKSWDFCGGFSSSRLDQPIVAALSGAVVALRPRERGDGHGDLRKGSGLPVNDTLMSCLAQMPKAQNSVAELTSDNPCYRVAADDHRASPPRNVPNKYE
jgi:hypothetical protein